MKKKIYVAVAAGFLSVASLPAFAQSVTGDSALDGVMDRSRPEYDAKGLPLGAFRLFPTISVDAGYDDNVLRQQTATDSSFFIHEAAGFKLTSQWSRHLFEVYANVDAFQFTDLNDENHTDYVIGENARIDIQRGFDFSVSSFWGVFHEARGSADLPGFAAEPTEYSQGHVEGALNYHPHRFGFEVGASLDDIDYDNTPVIGGGPDIFNDDRDRTVTNIFVKASYEFQPGTAIFVRASHNQRDFDLTLDRNGFNRDSTGERLDAGLDLMVTHLVHGQVFVGYLKQNYKAPLTDVSGFNYGVALDWYASPIFTVHVSAQRLLNDTTIFAASTSDDQRVGLGFDWEVRRNVIVQADASYTDSDFEGTTRSDQITQLGAGVKYLFNRYLTGNIRYDYQQRSSNIPFQDYNDNMVSVGLALHP